MNNLRSLPVMCSLVLRVARRSSKGRAFAERNSTLPDCARARANQKCQPGVVDRQFSLTKIIG